MAARWSQAPFGLGLGGLGLLGLVAGLVVLSGGTPAVQPADAPTDAFSAARAAADIAKLVEQGPRPITRGPPLPAHTAGRDRLLARLRQLGFATELQTGEQCDARRGCWTLDNVLGRLDPPGWQRRADARQAVLLLSHYDSVAAGPGAGDAAAGVGAVLEIARAIAATGPWRRPLLVVLDDGEEAGLLGAQLFLRHPWAAEVAAVLNFEARGTAGQTAMFETSDRSAWLIALYRDAVRRPVASSVIYSLYKTLPNDTDLTVTKAAGLAGLNFAFADADWNYHTARDDLAHLELGSVQHMGDQGLAVAQALLGRPELPAVPPSDEDAVWFDLFTRRLVVYRAGAAWALGGLLAVLWLLAAGLLARRGAGWAILAGLGRFVLSVLAATAVALLCQRGIAWLAGQPRPWRANPLPTFTALAAAAVLASLGVQRLGERWLRRDEAAPLALAAELVGALLLPAVAGLGLTSAAVGASYPFTLPALALLLGALTIALRRSLRAGAAALALWPGLVGAALVWFPLLRVIRVMVGAQVAPAVALPVAIVVGLYDPIGRLHGRRLEELVLVGAALVTLVAGAAAVLLR